MAMMVKDIGVNMAAGIPAGMVSAEGHSLLKGHYASADDLKQSMLGYMTVGGVLGAFTHAMPGGFTANQLGRTADTQAAPIELSERPALHEPAEQPIPTAASQENAAGSDAQTIQELRAKLAREKAKLQHAAASRKLTPQMGELFPAIISIWGKFADLADFIDGAAQKEKWLDSVRVLDPASLGSRKLEMAPLRQLIPHLRQADSLVSAKYPFRNGAN